MPEGVKHATGFCFDVENTDFLTCAHFTDNPQAKRVIEKCGFAF